MMLVTVIGAAGVLAGAGARLVLGRLARGARVPAPCCELAVGTLWALAAFRWAGTGAPVAWLGVMLGFGWLAVAAGAVDVMHRRLPDALTLSALPAVLLLVTPLGVDVLARAVAGAALLAGVHAAVRLVAPGALGGGDVKLAAPLGAALAASSWWALPVAVLLASVCTALLAVLALLAGRWAPGTALPHGPSMLGAGWAVALLGPVAG